MLLWCATVSGKSDADARYAWSFFHLLGATDSHLEVKATLFLMCDAELLAEQATREAFDTTTDQHVSDELCLCYLLLLAPHQVG